MNSEIFGDFPKILPRKLLKISKKNGYPFQNYQAFDSKRMKILNVYRNSVEISLQYFWVILAKRPQR